MPRLLIAALLVVFGGAFGWACDSFSGAEGAATSDGGVTGADGGGVSSSCDAIVASPMKVMFGEARTARDGGAPSVVGYELQVRNAGATSRVFRTSTAAPFAVVESGPMGLAPGEARPVHVTFTPAATGTATGALTVTTEDGCTSSVTLEGAGTDSAYAIAPAELSFDVLCKKTASAEVVIDVAPDASGGFTAQIGAPFRVAMPATLAAGQKTKILVELATPFSGAKEQADQLLTLNLPNEAPRQIRVKAASRGAVIAFESNSTGTHAVNNGNDVANVLLRGSDIAIRITPASATIQAGQRQAVGFQGPNIAWDFSVVQDPTKPGALCNDLSVHFDATSDGTEVGGGN